MKSKSRRKAKFQTTTSSSTTTTPSEFSHAIARIAVSQICRSVGFKTTQLSALETLTLVVTKYLQAIAKSATCFANNSNRTQANLLDLTNALHDVISLHDGGLSGGSHLHKHASTLLSTSGVLKDLARFVGVHEEIPFAKPIPRRDRDSTRNSIPSRTQETDCSRYSHVPKWLPGFPVDKKWQVKEDRESGERLWGESVSVGGDCGGIGSDLVCDRVEVEAKEGRDELGLGVVGRGRVRVRFRLRGIGVGTGLRNGIWRGGKRVCNWSNYDNENDTKWKDIGEDDKSSGFKRRRL